jgi:hypothetical protein
VAAPLRALALLLAGPALAACGGKSAPEDPAVAVGTGIPMGALSAGGVSFDAPLARAEPVPRSGSGKIEPLPKPLPLDPFEPAPTPPPIKIPKKKGTSL